MIIPFVNWGWKPRKPVDTSLRMEPNRFERSAALVAAQEKYNEEMLQFEESLSDDQRQMFYSLKKRANSVVFAQERMKVFEDGML